ncbi:thioesterase of the a b hydrolase superfamily bacterial origin [Cryptosporidium bovis]|uniref:thioesterase of the a b hydrolase superfamily bacterial origin n=1 Tax=Cryptosporidium bovis TaxID=310047 RepID=UPI00351A47D9|nr:thioesterase of the a b hydrolase superfamily bacterial origin [Cryptosporidium bovis]
MLKQEFKIWFPSYERINSGLLSGNNKPTPVCRLLCIPGAGSTDQVFVQKNIKGGDSSNILVDYTQENDIEVAVLQLPGRAGRSNEMCYTDIMSLINDFFPIFLDHFIGSIKSSEGSNNIPWILVGHSMGGLICFELLKKLKFEFTNNFIKEGKPKSNEELGELLRVNRIFPELLAIMSTFPPNIPSNKCPWRKSEDLCDMEFMEECRGWGINEAVFKKGIWEEFEKQLRCDFKMFDSYNLIDIDRTNYHFEWDKNSLYPLGLKRVQLWSATNDDKVTKEDIRSWKDLLVSREDSLEFCEVVGPHNFLHDANTRKNWMKDFISALDLVILELEYN